MTRKRTRQVVVIGILLLLLALLTAAYLQYRSTGRLGLDIEFNNDSVISPPQYLYSFAGSGAQRLASPLGVLVDDQRVYVTDSKRSVVDVFTLRGSRVAMWGQGKLAVPLYIAKNPKTGDFYVSDRRLRGVFIFGPDGTFKGEFDPKLPENELPKIKTDEQWAPLALAFDSSGALFATEILNGHRLVIFDEDGAFVRAVGTAGLVLDATSGAAAFQFPNSIKVHGEEVWIADSNNRRIQVFDKDGEFKRIIVTLGLPRGFDFLPKLTEDEPDRLVVVDTLSHDAMIMNAAAGSKELTFGTRGVLEAQFSYPNDASVDDRRRIFVADTANGRIQVWGWPATAGAIPTPDTPAGWLACLSPLLLLPFLLLLRKRRYMVTEDFVMALYDEGAIDRMPARKIRWEVLPADYENLRSLSQSGISLETLLHPAEHSESDAKALQTRYELEWEQAVVLALAQRAYVLCTEDPDLRRVARVLEIRVMDHSEYLERSEKKRSAAKAG